MKTIAIYHKNCADGTAAAAVVLRKYPDACLFPLGHSFKPEELQEVIDQAEKGDRILMVDCAIGAREFLAAGFPVTVIDHHAGAEDYLAGIAKDDPRFTYVFDNSKSGASLSWAHLFPGDKVPRLIELVEDMDLWKWRFGEDTKAANHYLSELLNKPEEVVRLLDAPIDALLSEGRAISRYVDTMIDRGVKNVDPVDVRVGDWLVPFYNITVYKSESGNILSTAQGKAVALYSIDGHEVKISFRSLDAHTPSALDMAKALGGGGHRNAAGATLTLKGFIAAIEDRA